MEKSVKQRKKRTWLDFLMLLIMVLGVTLLAYPFVSDKLNDLWGQQMISYYQKQANHLNEEAMEKLEKSMIEKNALLAEEGNNPGVSAFTNAVLQDESTGKDNSESKDYFDTHLIGVVYIPKITVNLPIFDQTTDLLLQKGATLLEGTSFPVGGENTHSVLSAHRGLAEAKLFTNLPKLEIGDEFYIDINGNRLAYEVDKIDVIEPTETELLLIQPGKDLVTLMTCTPYMLNTHRLLVRGFRVPYNPITDDKVIEKIHYKQKWDIIIVATLVLLVLAVLVLVMISIIKRTKTNNTVQ